VPRRVLSGGAYSVQQVATRLDRQHVTVDTLLTTVWRVS
jgi:hypothetical protein